MYDWKAINREIRAKIEQDGNDFGANSIAYDDNYAVIMYSSTGDDIYLKLTYDESSGENKVLLCEDLNANEKYKKIFGNLIQNLNINGEAIDIKTIDKTDDGNEICLFIGNNENKDFYTKNTINAFESIWAILTNTNKYEETKNLHETHEENLEATTLNTEEKQDTKNTNTRIRLINKINSQSQVEMFFELSDSELHNLELLITNDSETIIANIKAQNEFSYCLDTSKKVKLVISENNKKIYQSGNLGKIERTINKVEKIIEKQNDVEKKEESPKSDYVLEKPFVVTSDFVVNLEDISTMSQRFYK